MLINDEHIIKKFFGSRQIKASLLKELKTNILNKVTLDEYNYIIERYNDSKSFGETLFRIKHNIEKRPICINCGKEVKFIGKNDRPFETFCCVKCAQNNKEVRNKRLASSIKKYGYGCNIESVKQTCLNKYGVDNVFKTDWCIEKIKETTRIHYGVDNYGKTKKHALATHTPEVNQKRNDTKRKNGTFNSSKSENKTFKLLKHKFKHVLNNHKTDFYPFMCDFYVPKLDLYIECNYHWTHGKHLYDENSEEDVMIVNKWKSKNMKYYDNAIYTWTIRDVNKQNIADKNKLNYKVFYNFDDFVEWYNQQ